MAEDLSQQERELIANLVRDGKPVPARYIPSISESPLETELIWPGKTSEVSRVVLPFQSIEHIDEPRKGTQAQWDLFSMSESTGRQSGGWTNKLIWGDNSLILSSLANGPMREEIEKAGGLKLVYIDPPFDVGADFSMEVEIGGESVTKKPSVIEEVAYRDTWGKGQDSFLSMIYGRLNLIKDLMAPDGSIWIHCDWRLSGHLKLVMDEVFGKDNFINEVAVCYSGPTNQKRNFPRKHDTLFYYSKSDAYTFNLEKTRIDYKKSNLATGKTSLAGRADDDYLKELDQRGKQVEDYWLDIRSGSHIPKSVREEAENYPTLKDTKLLERIIEVCSNPGDLVADFFCGSGTTLATAERLERKWIGADLGRFAIHTSRKRLISIQRQASESGKPFRAFEILNLGGYGREYFAGIDTYLSEEDRESQLRIRREEFVKLILEAYGAQVSEQLPPFDGSKSGTAVLVGPVGAHVSQDQVQEAIEVALATGIARIDILGFEFEMGISPAMSDAAKELGITLTIKHIPNEVFDKRAVAKGQVKFYEAGYVEAKADVNKKTLKVSLTDFGVFYRQEDADAVGAELKNGSAKVVVDGGQVVRISKDKSGLIKKDRLTANWHDWIDYWAVDFDFMSQPEVLSIIEDGKKIKKRTGKYIFENEWQSFRTAADRDLELTSSEFTYAESGTYSVALKVIDIFGNDTTKVLKVVIK